MPGGVIEDEGLGGVVAVVAKEGGEALLDVVEGFALGGAAIFVEAC